MKSLAFLGTALRDLRAFPEAVRQRAGYQLHRVQLGLEPDDWRPMKTVGRGVRELRISTGRAFRVIYLASRSELVYVLHAFEKKSRKTPTRELEKARKRLAEIGDRQ